MTAAPDGKVARSGRAGRGDRIVVGPVDGFGPGERRIVAHGRRSIGVFNVGGNYYALAVTERLGVENSGGMVRVGAVHYNTIDEIKRLGAALRDLA